MAGRGEGFVSASGTEQRLEVIGEEINRFVRTIDGELTRRVGSGEVTARSEAKLAELIMREEQLTRRRIESKLQE